MANTEIGPSEIELARFERPSGRVDVFLFVPGAPGRSSTFRIRSRKANGWHYQLVFDAADLPRVKEAIEEFSRLQHALEPPANRAPPPAHRPGVPRGRVAP